MPNLKDKIIKEIKKDKEIDLENISEEDLKEIIKEKVKNKNLSDNTQKIDDISKDIFNEIISQNVKIPKSINKKALGLVRDLGHSTKIYAIIRTISVFWGYQSSYFTVGIGDLIYFVGTSLFLFILGSRIENLNDKRNKKNIKILTFYFLLLTILSPSIDKLIVFIFFIYSLIGLNRWKKLTKNKAFEKNLIDVDYEFKKRDWIISIIVFIILFILGTWADVQNGLYDDYLSSNKIEYSIVQKKN